MKPIYPLTLLIALAWGCSTFKPVHEELHHYILSPQPLAAANRGTTAHEAMTVLLKPVDVARYLEGRDIAVRNGDNEITYPMDDRWAEPLDAGIRRVLTQDLGQSRAVSFVLTDEPSPGRQVTSIYVRLLACDAVKTNGTGSIAFAAQWEITSRSEVTHGLFHGPPARWSPGDYGGFAAAISRDLRDFSDVLLNELQKARMVSKGK